MFRNKLFTSAINIMVNLSPRTCIGNKFGYMHANVSLHPTTRLPTCFINESETFRIRCRRFSTNDVRNSTEDINVSIESKIIALTDMWKMEAAVKLFRKSVENGVLPNHTVVLNLLQQLGNLGDFECLLSLREILMDKKLCSIDNFFRCLNDAYHNSGRIEEAVLLLRMLYHDTRKYDDVDVFFTLIGIMLLEHFPSRFDLLESFAEDCRQKEPPDFLPTAGLWKCFVLSGKFDKANALGEEFSEIRRHLPKMIGDIANKKNKVDVNRTVALSWISNLPQDMVKEKLRVHVMLEILKELVMNKNWNTLDQYLDALSSDTVSLPPEQVKQLIDKTENILFNDDLDNFVLIQCIDKLKRLL